jgi:hypothetical protein
VLPPGGHCLQQWQKSKQGVPTRVIGLDEFSPNGRSFGKFYKSTEVAKNWAAFLPT